MGSIVENVRARLAKPPLRTNTDRPHFNLVNRNILQTAGICNCFRSVVTRARKLCPRL